MTDVLTSVLAVLTGIAEWFVEAISSLLAIFYTAEAGLTIMGVLAVIGVGIGVILLVVSIIQRFFALRA